MAITVRYDVQEKIFHICFGNPTGTEERLAERIVRYARRTVAVPSRRRAGQEELVLGGSRIPELLLPAHGLRAKREGIGLRLGPVVAIYALPFPGGSIFGPQTGLFAEFARTCRRLQADCYVLTPGRLLPESNSAAGFRLEGNEWLEQRCPWPDFVWRRVTSRPHVWQDRLLLDENLLERTAIIGSIPRRENDKWSVYRLLHEHPNAQGYLPETRLIAAPRDVVEFLDDIGDVYVKPVRGTQGKLVYRIRKQGVAYMVTGDKGAPKSRYLDARRLESWLRFKLRDESFVVQETVPLMKTKSGEPFDLRFVVQRGKGADPVVTAAIARVAKPFSVTTNLHTGGKAIAARELGGRLAAADAVLYRRALDEAFDGALVNFQALIERFKYLTELGIDVAVDQSGRARILEVNPCPGRRMLREVNPELRDLSIRRVAEYAVLCTGFGAV